MSRAHACFRFLSRLSWWLLSVPVFIKVLGISLVVALLFGAITLFHTGSTLSRSLYGFLEQRTRADAYWLAASLERPMSQGDQLTIREKLARAVENAPDVRYIIVREPGGRIAAHTFKSGVPPDLERLWSPPATGGCDVLTLGSREGLIVEARCPILGGSAGSLQLGVSDRQITAEVRALNRSVLWTLGFSMVLGTALGLLLTHLFMTRPIYRLARAANRVRQGDFDARATVVSADEIGRLAAAFNEMAESLRRYRSEVEEKEKARLSLLDMIVQAQEEERKSIARELHDQVGQSLAALLLAIQSGIPQDQLPAQVREDLAAKLRELSDEVHRLAWGMRPAILDDYGLDSALSRYVAEMASRSGLTIDYQFSGAPDLGRLPSRIEVPLYRIVQEAITNIVSHANATRAGVVVLRQQRTVTLVVEDNGQGFDVASAPGSRCLGLTGMKERAALVGGECLIESKPGAGTTIRVTIPLGGAEPSPAAAAQPRV